MDINQEELDNIIKNLKMYKVYSTNIKAIGYYESKKILRVIFNNSSSYIYFNVEPSIWSILFTSEHKGRTLNECIIKQKEKYKYIKLS